MQMTKRIFYLDELRALAIVAVILCHVSNLYPHGMTSFKTLFPFFVNDLGVIGVPIFLMLSGALLLNRDYELGSFFKRRFSRILIPFIFWVILICLIRLFVFKDSVDEIIGWSMGHGLTWYVYMLIGLYVAMPVVNTFLNRYGMDAAKYFIIFWVVNIFMYTFHINYFNKLSFEFFMGPLGYMVLGYYLYNSDFRFDDRTMIIMGFIMFIVFYLINCYLSTISGSTVEYVTFATILESAGVFLIVKHIASYSQKNSGSAVSKIHSYIENGVIGSAVISISICSYGMYFSHYLVYHALDMFHFHSLKLIPILLIFTLLLSWAIIWIMSKIPYLNKVCGV